MGGALGQCSPPQYVILTLKPLLSAQSVCIMEICECVSVYFMSNMILFLIQKRKGRTLQAIRAKRKRYREKKKSDGRRKKQSWEIQLEQELCARWKKRREDFEQEQADLEATEALSTVSNINEDEVHSPKNLHVTDADTTRDKGQCPVDTSPTNQVLSLPSVRVPEKSHESAEEIKSKIPIASLSGVESVSVVSYVQEAQKKTVDALHLAQYYRDLAEKMQDQKIENEETMKRKVKRMRNFWRNNILEGSTRAGKILRNALQL